MFLRAGSLLSMAKTKRTLLRRIDRNVRALLDLLAQPRLRIRFGPVGTRSNLPPPQGTRPMLTLTDIQHVTATLSEVDAANNPVPTAFDTPPTWTSSDDTVVTVTPSADGVTADIVTTGKLGTAQIKALSKNDAGEDITTLGDIEVVVSAGTTVTMTFGTPANK